ncbi:P-loop containing nucleoside triphosphate hydrolase protein [Teratosphaeria nubilosa]|uniref:P-loop containing nucleoside triphosphate hydrolase protein n=1 Tax=Teratosphaeria nubilosa TaxID=161662 RepID=A0A6G1LE11_9PEZI|nr:P-loop containing nucleoside triphosphate hydrolase protein [Teratosphaeria nubilosa]
MTRRNMPCLMAGILASFIAGAVIPATAYLTGKLFDGFTDHASGQTTNDEFYSHQTKYILYLAVASAGSWISHACEFIFWLAFGELQAKSARDRLFHGLLKKDIEWYDMRKNGIGAMLPRMQAQIRDLQLGASQPLGIVVNAIAQTILSLAEAFYYSWKLALVTLSPFPVLVVIMVIVGNFMQRNIIRQQEKLGTVQKYTQNAFSAIETVKCFNGQDIERQKYMKGIREAATFYFREAHASGMQMGASAAISAAMFVAGFYYGGTLIANGSMSAGDVVTTFFAATGAVQGLAMVLPLMLVLEKGRTAGTTLRMIMAEVEGGTESRRLSSGVDVRPTKCEGSIEVRHATFAYPTRRESLALDNVSMSIAAGEMTFLIGKSGSGKSTISQLLMRFYALDQGTIHVDGQALDSLDANWLRSNITLVEQASTLFNDTVFRNIAFGRQDHEDVTREEVMAAIEFALLKMTITDMPNGLDTQVGFMGGALSGGQRQRMALARARLRDTPILILDESTSALDVISRQLMMDAIRQWRKGRTTIIITHDISQILPDDYAYILENGRLVQEGYRKHMELMRDTPFQDFLAPDHQADALSDQQSDVGTTDEMYFDEEYPASPTSIYSTDEPQHNHIVHDPLDELLNRGENKRTTFRPATTDMSPYPIGGVFGRQTMHYSPHVDYYPSTRSSPYEVTGIKKQQDWSTISSQFSPQTSYPGEPRASVMLEKIVQQGRMAADSRLDTQGAPHKRRTRGDAEAALAALNGDSEKRDKGEKSSKTQQVSVKGVLSTVWPNIECSAKVVLLTGFYGATIHAVATPMTSYMLSKLMETYSNPKHSQHKQLIYSMAMLGIAGIDAFHAWLMRFAIGCVAQLWVDNHREKAVKCILDQSKDFFDKEENAVSRLCDVLDRNSEMMRELLANFAGLGYLAVLMCTVSVIWAITVSWKMTLIALAVAPYVMGVTRLFTGVSGKWEKASNDATEDASAIFSETFTNIKTVRALTLEEHFRRKYIAATDHGLVVGLLRSFNTGFFFGVSDSAGNFATTIIFYVGTKLVISGTSVNDVVMVVVMLLFAITQLAVILECIPQVNASQDSAARLLRLANLPKTSHEHLGDTRITTVGDIVFENLSFAYPSRPEQAILKDINLRIEPRTSTAIVGGSGSGKSTIANLLLNIWSTTQCPPPLRPTPTPGDLTIASRSINQIATPALRSLIVPVQQTPTLFPATVAENITYGLPPDSPHNTSSAIEDAARRAGIHDFIASLPAGYSTALGDGGTVLSGGQAQRVAIARALVRNPAVLILDEATSALDVASASVIRDTVRGLVRTACETPMTVVIITHGREMMEIAERVVVLERGVVLEQGGFRELVGRGGALAGLLSGGLWEGGCVPVAGMGRGRKRVVPRLREVDWGRGRERRGRPATRNRERLGLMRE